MSTVAIICPDTNAELSVDAPERTAIRGGKSAIVKLAAAWAHTGHDVTIFAGRVRPGSQDGLAVRAFDDIDGNFDVAIYVSGALGHFPDPPAARARAQVNILWLNGPGKVEPPAFVDIDWFIVPADFLARRAIDEWQHPSERVVVIRGESAGQRNAADNGSRDLYRGVYASHPSKGLREAGRVIARCQAAGRCTLDVFGSDEFSGGSLKGHVDEGPWLDFVGEATDRELAARMSHYGFMPYFTEWQDGFSTATAEAMAAGVVVFATAHGSNAEFIQHGWNGYLVRAIDGRPDLDQAVELLSHYLRDPDAFEAIRTNARGCVPTWDEQARQWVSVWER